MERRAYSLYEVERFIREAGAEKVTEDAVQDLEKELERLTELLAQKAKLYAQHAGRNKLIKKEDIALLHSKYRKIYKRPANFITKASATNNSSMQAR